MATYDELYDLAEGNALIDRITSAIAIAADKVVNEDPITPNHANRLIWAKQAFQTPKSFAKPFWYAMLAANNSLTPAAILAASDSAIQNNVDAVVDTFAGA